jgi:putative transposase
MTTDRRDPMANFPRQAGPRPLSAPLGPAVSTRTATTAAAAAAPTPNRRRRSPGQIVELLRQADALLTRGLPLSSVIATFGVSEATFHRWRAQYGGIKAEDARRLRELEKENRDLKSQIADQSLDILMLRQALSPEVLGPRLRAAVVRALRARFGVSERRACEVIGQPRSSHRRVAQSDGVEELAAELADYPPDGMDDGELALMALAAGVVDTELDADRITIFDSA